MNVPYIFWACNMVEQLRLQDQISIALRMRSSVQHGRSEIELSSLTAGELKCGVTETLNCLRAVLHSCIIFVERQLTGRDANSKYLP